MGATLATIDPLLKEVYQGAIREQLNDETIALTRITRSSSNITSEIGGKYVTFPVHTRRNSGIGSRLEQEALPTPGNQGFAAARVGLKYAYAGVQLTGQAIALSESNQQAFAQILDNEMSRLKVDIKKDLNRQIYGSGNGAIATIASVATSATQAVTDARYLQLGEVVDVITLPSTVSQSGLTVTAVNVVANTVTLSASFTSVVGQIIVRRGSGPAASGNRELTGLGGIIDNASTLFNIAPGTEPTWASEVDSNGGTGRAISESTFIKMIDRIRINGGQTSLILTSLGVRRAYFNLVSQTRQTVNSVDFKGGFKGLAFITDLGEVPLVADPDGTLNTAYFINEPNLTYYRDEEWHWLDRDGSIWKQVRDTNGDYDAWYARIAEYHELATDRRNTHGVVKDLTEA